MALKAAVLGVVVAAAVAAPCSMPVCAGALLLAGGSTDVLNVGKGAPTAPLRAFDFGCDGDVVETASGGACLLPRGFTIVPRHTVAGASIVISTAAFMEERDTFCVAVDGGVQLPIGGSSKSMAASWATEHAAGGAVTITAVVAEQTEFTFAFDPFALNLSVAALATARGACTAAYGAASAAAYNDAATQLPMMLMTHADTGGYALVIFATATEAVQSMADFYSSVGGAANLELGAVGLGVNVQVASGSSATAAAALAVSETLATAAGTLQGRGVLSVVTRVHNATLFSNRLRIDDPPCAAQWDAWVDNSVARAALAEQALLVDAAVLRANTSAQLVPFTCPLGCRCVGPTATPATFAPFQGTIATFVASNVTTVLDAVAAVQAAEYVDAATLLELGAAMDAILAALASPPVPALWAATVGGTFGPGPRCMVPFGQSCEYTVPALFVPAAVAAAAGVAPPAVPPATCPLTSLRQPVA